MLTPNQLLERKNYLGASDAAGVLGLSRWSSPISVWADKTGAVPKEDISDKLFVKLGHLLEDDMTEIFEDQTGKKLHRVNETKFHPVHPFLAANLDRRIVGENVPVELKTANAFKSKEWSGEEIPREYLIQCMHTLAVTVKPYMYLGVLIGSKDFPIKRVERDEAIIEHIVTREVAFWNEFVVPKIIPNVVTKYDDDTLQRMWPYAIDGEPVKLPDEASQLIEILDGYNADAKNLKGLIAETENKLKLLLGEHATGITPSGAMAKWLNTKRNSLDQKSLKNELPHIHAMYYKETASRRFDYHLKKEEAHVQ